MADRTSSWRTTFWRVVKCAAIGVVAIMTLYYLVVAIFLIGAMLGLWPIVISDQ